MTCLMEIDTENLCSLGIRDLMNQAGVLLIQSMMLMLHGTSLTPRYEWLSFDLLYLGVK